MALKYKTPFLFLLLFAVIFAGTSVSANEGRDRVFQVTHINNIEILQPYGHPSLEGRNGAVFMEIHNLSTEDDSIIAARTKIAGKVELHTHKMAEGIMQMRPVPSIDIPAGGKVSLEPMGLHVMLIGLQEKLETGDSFPLVLEFEKTGPVLVKTVITEQSVKPSIYDRYSDAWKCSCACNKGDNKSDNTGILPAR